jgi:hypothetical protein
MLLVGRWLGDPLAIALASTVMVVRDGEPWTCSAPPEDLRGWLAAEPLRLGDCAFALGHLDEILTLVTPCAPSSPPRPRGPSP